MRVMFSRRMARLAGVVVAAVVLALAAVLIWGPVGLGSGPLTVYAPSGGQVLGQKDQVWGLIVPLQAGDTGAVIDGVSVAGGAGYSAPRVLAIWTMKDRQGQCGGMFPWRGPGSIMSSCAIGGLHALVGVPLPGNEPGIDMVLAIGPQVGPDGCWSAMSMVVHYHVWIRHYTVTVSDSFVACKSPAEEDRAELAVGQL